MRQRNLIFSGLVLTVIFGFLGCAQGPAPATSTPSATCSGDKALDSVTATYRVGEDHSLVEAKRVEKDTGMVE